MHGQQPEDAELMRRIVQGDELAFADLLQRHLSGVRAYLLRLCASPSDADDLTQECLLKVWRKASQYQASQGAVSTWLYRIAHNGFIDFSRRLPPAAHSLDVPNGDSGQVTAEAIQATNAGPETQAETGQALEWLNGQLKHLPLNQRSALVLRYLQGQSIAQTAAVLGISETAAESLAARAKRYLRARLATSNPEFNNT